ncbi:MAG: cyclic nucleotide-binding protein [Rhizobiaceae bacterium]|nr:cyclic nucleotide-binding protein [Rhizobiaceae bacterium]
MTVSDAFLVQLPEAELARLASKWTVRNYQPHQFVISHGDRDSDVFFLLEGRARATLFSETGREVAYREIGPGDIFGELSGIDGLARSATIVALAPTRVARLSQAQFRDFVEHSPVFTWALLTYLSGSVRRMTNRVYEFSTLVVRKRLICELLRRAEGKRQEGGRALVDPAPTHFELASSISTHREAVSREMSALAKRKLIARRETTLVLLDLTALELLADKEPEDD